MTKLAMLLANQRSGTHALRSALSSDPTIGDAGEIFTGRNPNAAHALLAQQIRESANFVPDRPTLNVFFDRLCDQLRRTHAMHRVCVFDVKYNAFGPFNPYGWRVSEEPYFLTYAKRRKLPIVHLIRRNLVAGYISVLRAQKTQQWHRTADAEERELAFRIRLDEDEFLEALRIRVEERNLMQKYVRGYARHIEVHYEDLFEGHVLSESVRQSIGELFGHAIQRQLPTGHLKIKWDWKDSILNYDEMKSWIAADSSLSEHCGEFL